MCLNELINNKKKSEILATEISKLNYGDTILHTQIAKIIEVEYPSNKYTTTIRKARRILLKKGIVLENIVGDGYRLVQPDDFVDQSLRHYKRGFNEMQKGYDTLNAAPTDKMTQEGLNRFRRVYDRSVSLQASMKGVSVELKELSGKKKHPFAIDSK